MQDMPVSRVVVTIFTHKDGLSRNNKSLVDEITTLRRHLEANHAVSTHFMP